MAVLIKRYANRKLYNTQASRYITLKGIAELVEAGEDVRVVDNETGEDITSVTLSQILVDSERSQHALPGGLLLELIQRGGDVLYHAVRRSVGDASEGIEELQRNVRRLLSRESARRDWIAFATGDLERLVQGAVERVFRLLDLPRRSDVEALTRNLERVADALDALEHGEQAPQSGARSGTKPGEVPRAGGARSEPPAGGEPSAGESPSSPPDPATSG